MTMAVPLSMILSRKFLSLLAATSLIFTVLLVDLAVVAESRASFGLHQLSHSTRSISTTSMLFLELRGGAAKTTSTTSSTISKTKTGDIKKKRKKKKKKKRSTDPAEAKKAIDNAMKEKDAAEALGDAIRDSADILRQEDPLLQSIDWSVSSVGRALGASDAIMMSAAVRKDESAGGVQASPSSVIANYFLKSHGGAHGLQSACSLLATICAFGALSAGSKQNGEWTLIFLRRTLIFAMIKHMSGLLASASVAAKAIPKIGLTEARKWMEDIVKEPVAQYVFYTSLLLLWLPKSLTITETAPGDDAATAVVKSATWWWPQQRWIISMVVAPILLREVISNLLVLSDVLVLWSVGSGVQYGILENVLKVSQSVVNAVMSLLVSPAKWRKADPAERQAILATLITKISLAFEAGVGVVLVWDLLFGFLQLIFGMGGQRPALHQALLKVLVVRLYVHYLLWKRKKRYAKLAVDVRGGAYQLPLWVLDSIYSPTKALGISLDSIEIDDAFMWKGLTLREILAVGFGLEDKS